MPGVTWLIIGLIQNKFLIIMHYIVATCFMSVIVSYTSLSGVATCSLRSCGLNNQRSYLIIQKAQKIKIKLWEDLESTGDSLSSVQMANFSLCHMVEKEGTLFSSSFHKGINLVIRVQTSYLYLNLSFHFQKPPYWLVEL